MTMSRAEYFGVVSHSATTSALLIASIFYPYIGGMLLIATSGAWLVAILFAAKDADYAAENIFPLLTILIPLILGLAFRHRHRARDKSAKCSAQ